MCIINLYRHLYCCRDYEREALVTTIMKLVLLSNVVDSNWNTTHFPVTIKMLLVTTESHQNSNDYHE